MKFRSNQLQVHYNLADSSEIYLKQFLSAAAVQSSSINSNINQEEHRKPASKSVSKQQSSAASKPAVGAAAESTITTTSTTTKSSVITTSSSSSSSSSISNMKNKSASSAVSSTLNSVSGLNNLGNSCFFNAVLQNIAQTPYLVDLLKENFTTQNRPFLIRHNSEFDSELDDDDEPADERPAKGSSGLDERDDSDSTSDVDLGSDTGATSGSKSGASGASSPRSMRLGELRITVKEASGPLSRQLFETIKSMTSARITVNPSPLFGQICKKIPSYKGFQQQDSHELLINLLDSIKTEELKRRQAGILEALRVNPKSIDDVSKRRIKRYGRLASYTFVDKLFGGHLLSSVVCEECKTCSHRIEPFLDLSLPIVDENAKLSTSLMSTLAQTGSSKIANVGSTFQKARGKLKTISNPKAALAAAATAATTIDPAAAFRKDSVSDDNSSKQLSKHQLKKQKKTAKKTKRKGRGKGDENETDEPESKNDVDSLKEGLCKLEIADKEQPDEAENDDEDSGESKTKVEANGHENGKENDDATSKEHDDNDDVVVVAPGKDSNEPEASNNADNDAVNAEADDDDDYDDEEDDKEHKYMNTFRLEAMKTARSSLETADEPGCSIQLCLAKFTANELLREKLSCDFCTSRLYPHGASGGGKSKASGAGKSSAKQPAVYTSALKQYLICELPAVMIIHLKRFQQHGYRLEKSNKHVSFSLLLDMSPFTSKMCVNLYSSKRTSAGSLSPPQALYSLYGLVEHSGRLNSGHYTAYVKANPKPGFHNDQAAFLGSQRICHLKSMLKRWNGKSLTPKTIEDELAAKQTQEELFNQYLDLEGTSGSSAEADDDDSTTTTNSGAENAPPAEDKWYHISDSSVSEVSVSKVLKAQAYLLFYERIQ